MVLYVKIPTLFIYEVYFYDIMSDSNITLGSNVKQYKFNLICSIILFYRGIFYKNNSVISFFESLLCQLILILTVYIKSTFKRLYASYKLTLSKYITIKSFSTYLCLLIE